MCKSHTQTAGVEGKKFSMNDLLLIMSNPRLFFWPGCSMQRKRKYRRFDCGIAVNVNIRFSGDSKCVTQQLI